MWTAAAIAGGVVAAGALIWWLLRRRKRKKQGQGSSDGDSSGGGGSGGGGRSGESPEDRARREAEEERRRAERERQRAEEAARREAERRRREDVLVENVREIMRIEPELAGSIQRRTGLAHGVLRDVSSSREAALKIAQQLGREMLRIMWLAAKQTDIDIDLGVRTEREPVHHPTDDIEPENMRELSQMHGILPEQLLMDDDMFYDQLARDQLMVMQPYEEQKRRKRLYILLDVSGSMDGDMSDGHKRHVWARGVTVNLLMKAIKGEAEYLLRAFDGSTYTLHEATTRDEAEKLVDHILDQGFSGQSTDIFGAFRRAVEDIRARRGSAVETSEILIITDGQDGSMDDTARVREMLGGDIRLHVCLIGAESDPLREVAESYRVMS